jgi:hypothetical protein
MKKPTLSLLLRLFGAAAFATTFAACSGTAGTTPAEAAPAAKPAAAPIMASNLKQQIDAAIGDAACDSAAQCKTMALGHKACGGPEGYVAYSTKGGNADAIVRLGAAYEAESRSQTIKSGMMSTCSVQLDPGATCSAGHCVKQGAGGAVAR